ncbi:MAG: hypothetical protein J7K49_00810 [Thaumarchaeota archaeon]|nr:hypothetical protein [Nitrososphaerota archaeon]
MFHHPRILDYLPESRGVHLITCRGCGRKFESLTPPDPDDPLTFYCADCLLSGKVRNMGEDREKQRAESDWRRLAERFKEEGEKKIEEATKALEEALENFKLAARCLEQAMKSEDSDLNEKWRGKQ